jgi:CII-binding regulator of phage lambda lysogenization HflD
MWSVNNQYVDLRARIDTFHRSRLNVFIRELRNYAFEVVADTSDTSKEELQAIGEGFKEEASEMYIELFKYQHELIELTKQLNSIKKTSACVGARSTETTQLCEKISIAFTEVENYMLQMMVVSTCDEF